MARAYCNRCDKAQAACICSWTAPVANKTRIIILQHPDEVKKALGTARIATLCLNNIELWEGVDFSNNPHFIRLMSESTDGLRILYPVDSALDISAWKDKVIEFGSTKCIGANSLADSLIERENIERTLIILDGTWRNTREILCATPRLNQLQKVKLNPNNLSDYRIRKAPSVESLATIEAIYYALNILEPDTKADVILDCFKKMIDYQISCMGEDVYRRNYCGDSIPVNSEI